jgi:hypothetical protein
VPAPPGSIPGDAVPETIPVMDELDALRIGKALAERQVVLERFEAAKARWEAKQLELARDFKAKTDLLNQLTNAAAERAHLDLRQGWQPDADGRIWRKETKNP